MIIANAYNFILIVLSVHVLVKGYFSIVYYHIFLSICRTFFWKKNAPSYGCGL